MFAAHSVLPSGGLPVAFDASGAGGLTKSAAVGSASISSSWSHTVAADANCLVVPIMCWDYDYPNTSGANADTTHSRSVTFNGVALSSAGATPNTQDGFIEWLYLLNPAAGAHTLAYTVTRTGGTGTLSWIVISASMSYKNVVGVNNYAGNSGFNSVPTVTHTSKFNDMSVGALTIAHGGDPTGYNGTTRRGPFTSAGYGYSEGLTGSGVTGDKAGAASVNHAEVGTSNSWVAAALNLRAA